jgi:hypothetical protein
MKKLFLVLCVVVMFFGIVGCPGDGANSQGDISTLKSATSTPVATANGDQLDGPGASPVPEPTTLILLGAGLVGLAGVGRKKFFKKD